MRRAPVRGIRTTTQCLLDDVERRAVRARAGECDGEGVFGVLELDEVVERRVARGLDEPGERDRSVLERAGVQEVFGHLQLALERLERAALDVDQLHRL